jgi:hypothetical protein
MPLLPILPAVPSTPPPADMVVVAGADRALQLEVPAADGSALGQQVSVQEVIETAPLTEARWLFPLAQDPLQDSAPLQTPAHLGGIEEGEAGPEGDRLNDEPPHGDAADPGAGGEVDSSDAPDPVTDAESPLEPSQPLDPADPVEVGGSIFLRADRQVFEPIRQIVTATGDVLIQFGTGQIAADRLWVNLANRHVQAAGNVFFNRNNQIVEADSATYYLLQGAGTLANGRGELEISTLEQDLSDPFADTTPGDRRPLDYRLQNRESISQATSTGRVAAATSDAAGLTGGQPAPTMQRLRFETDQIFFDAEGWYAEGLRLTNDPFSPPQLEFRADDVRLTPLNENEDELVFSAPRLVLDQWLTIPIFRRRYVLTRGQLPEDAFNPIPTGIGFDGRDRDGLFVERELPINVVGPLSVSIAPQFLVSRWLGDSNYNLADPANFGLSARADGPLGPRTFVTANLSLAGLDFANLENRLRASVRGQQRLGTHRLNLEYSYRDRLFNGSLGFQDVQSSLGMLLESPNIVLGNTGLNLTYQVSGQYVTANTDRADLLNPGEGIGLASLGRFQGAADLSRSFLLWQGQPLPATADEGLRYSDRPLVPSLSLNAGLRGVTTYYTSNDLQESLEGRLSLTGQVGRLQRDVFDYTQFNIGLSSSFIGGDTSPFLFDRTVDQLVLNGGIVQQIYGPFLAGFQSQVNLNTGRVIDTNVILEYRRRAYGLLVTYSPQQETGFLGFRISNFDWTGRPAPLDADPDAPSDVIVP